VLSASVTAAPVTVTPLGGGSFGGGDGSAGNPYNITDVLDLQAMSGNLSANYTLVCDIDATNTSIIGNPSNNQGRGFIPIGNLSDPFTGNFDGQGHTIIGLYMSGPWNYTGLFGCLAPTAVIENVNLDNIFVNCWQWRGALAGLNNGGTIRNCSASGTIGYASNNTGGLVGRSVGGIIDNCTSSCSVTSTNGNNIGGFVGNAYSAVKITNCHASGTVQGVDNVGGFVGNFNIEGSEISNCSATGNVHGDDLVGGFVGQSTLGSDITDCHSAGDVNATGTGLGRAGGFIGSHGGAGLVQLTVIQRCYASGDVFGASALGGFAGTNGDTAMACIYDCYALGDVSGTGSTAGGFLGSWSHGPVERCYSTGAPGAIGGGVGGFVGYVSLDASWLSHDNRWDNETSGFITGSGDGFPAVIQGNYTSQLLEQNTYQGFDFTNVWWILNGETRPFLRMEWSTDIRNSHQLQLVHMNLSVNYTLKNDIDLSDTVASSQMWGTSNAAGKGFMPLGDNTDSFNRCFDGKGYTISNMYINRSTEALAVGLFRYLNLGSAPGSRVENLALENCSITGQDSVGGLVGENHGSTIANCSGSGTVHGSDYVGGLIGYLYNCPVMNCSSSSNVIGIGDYVGGLIGESEGTIMDCSSTGNVSGEYYVGGFVGQIFSGAIMNCTSAGNAIGTASYIGGFAGENSVTISNCTSTGNAESDTGNNVGGFVGYNGGAAITDCTGAGSAEGDSWIGGFVGDNDGPITNCSSAGSASGSNYTGGFAGGNRNIISGCSGIGSANGTTVYVGGFAGYNYGSGTIINCTSAGNVGESQYAGGFVGENAGTIANSSSSGNAIGTSDAGGFVGDNLGGTIRNCYSTGEAIATGEYVGGFAAYNSGTGTIMNCYSIANASGSNYVGGFIGYNSGTIAACFWDTDTSGTSTGIGAGTMAGATGKTTVDMKTQATFTTDLGAAAWDFDDIWWMQEGLTYPLLRWAIDITPPEIISTDPVHQEDGVAVDVGTYVVVFDKEMDATVTAVDTNLPGVVTSWHDGFTFHIGYGELDDLTEYYVDFTGKGHKDVLGIALGGDMLFNFTTGDFTAPTIVSWAPSGDNVATAAGWLNVTFSEPIDSENPAMNPSQLRTNLPGFSPVGWNAESTMVTFTYGIMSETTLYYLDFSVVNVLDMAGHSLEGEMNVTFTTGDFTAPTITATMHAQDATGVSVAAGYYEATFSEPMAAAGTVATGLPGASGSWQNTTVYRVTYTALADSTEYGLTFNDFTDTAGNPLAGTTVWTFTTGDFTDPVANAGPDQIVDEDTVVSFNGTASTDNVAIATYSWTFTVPTGAVTLTGTQPTYTFTTPGVYTVTLNVTDTAGNWVTDTMTVTVNDITDPVANAGTDQAVPEGTIVTFNGIASTDNVGITNYTWNFTFGGSAVKLYGVSPEFNFTIAGNYTVTLTVKDAAGNTGTDAMLVAVSAVPTADITSPVANAGDDQSVTAGTVVTFDGSGSTDNVGIANYTWTFTFDGAARTLYGVAPTFNFTTAGNYTVTLAVSDIAGNTDTDIVLVAVNPTIAPPAEETGGGQGGYLWIGLILVIVAVVALLTFLMMGKAGAPKEAGPEEAVTEPEAPAKQDTVETESPAPETEDSLDDLEL